MHHNYIDFKKIKANEISKFNMRHDYIQLHRIKNNQYLNYTYLFISKSSLQLLTERFFFLSLEKTRAECRSVNISEAIYSYHAHVNNESILPRVYLTHVTHK